MHFSDNRLEQIKIRKDELFKIWKFASAPADGIGCGTPEEDGFGLFQSVVLVNQADGGRRILVVPDEHVIGRKLQTDYNVSGTQATRNTCAFIVPILLISFVDPDQMDP